MLRRASKIFLGVTALLFIAGLLYLLIFAPKEEFYLEELVRHRIDLRYLGAALLTILIGNNAILLAVLQMDIFKRYSLKLKLDSQALFAVNQEIPVILTLKETISAPVDEMLDVEAPIHQSAHVKVTDVVHVPVDFSIPMPIDEVVNVEAQVPVQTTIHLDTHLEAPVLGKLVKIPIHLDVPLDLDIPVSCKARIRKPDFVVHVKDTLPLHIKDPVPVQVDTVLKTRFPFKKIVTIPVDLELHSKVRLDQSEAIKVQGEFTLTHESVRMKLIPGGDT